MEILPGPDNYLAGALPRRPPIRRRSRAGGQRPKSARYRFLSLFLYLSRSVIARAVTSPRVLGGLETIVPGKLPEGQQLRPFPSRRVRTDIRHPSMQRPAVSEICRVLSTICLKKRLSRDAPDRAPSGLESFGSEDNEPEPLTVEARVVRAYDLEEETFPDIPRGLTIVPISRTDLADGRRSARRTLRTTSLSRRPSRRGRPPSDRAFTE